MNLINWLGVGKVTSTKNTNTKEIMVHLPSQAPTADGRGLTQVETKTETSLNAAGEEETSTTMVSNVVPAEWSSLGEPNRKTAPDVREGSSVAVYQVSGQNKYYWTTYGFSAETHRLETIVWGYSSNPSIDENTPFSVDDYYTVTVDTRSAVMSVRTSQANNEKSALEVRIDGGKGRVDFTGSSKSILCFDDHERSLTYRNKDNSVFSINKKKFLAVCEDSCTFNPTESFNLVTKVLNIQVKTVNVKASEANIAIPITNWEGDVKLKGNIDQEGDVNQQGDFTQTGDSTSTGIVKGMTDVQTATVSLNTHMHPGVENGDGITAAPAPSI